MTRRFGPDRLGHALFLDAAARSLVARRKIPVELCPTSNVKTLQLTALEEVSGVEDSFRPSPPPATARHLMPRRRPRPDAPLPPPPCSPTLCSQTSHRPSPAVSQHPTAAEWISRQHPFNLNTDDSGVFNTTLSEEYHKFARAFGLTDKVGAPQRGASVRGVRCGAWL